MPKRFHWVLMVTGCVLPALALAREPDCLPPGCVTFPADAGVLNVRDFGAKGDGVTDDTNAINAALAASGGDRGPAFWHDKLVYVPDGAYLISAPLVKRYPEGRFASGAMLIGQSRDGTILRLRDRAPGYDSPARPKAMIFTAAKLLDGSATSGGKDYTNKGEGNDAFMNFVENMTIDAGEGNPGAIGIDYLANNVGAVRNVIVKAPNGSGATGIAMTRKWPGPALVQDVAVQGFATGIDVAHSEYGVTLERIVLENQRAVGLRNDHNAVSAYAVTIRNAPLPVVNVSENGLIVLHNAELTNHAPASAAIDNRGYMNLREVRVSGYETALDAKGDAVLDGAYHKDQALMPSKTSWALPVKNPPPVPADPVASWVSVARFGAAPDTEADMTEALRAAFASGASTIYFPNGTYKISENITIPASVRRIAGMNSTIQAHPQRKPGFRRDQGMFRAQNTLAPLFIERMAFDHSYLGDQVAVEAMGSQPIILRDIIGAGVTTLLRPEHAGEAFIENTCCGIVSVAGAEGVWARQLNTEGMGVRIANHGAPLWVLGIKTERNCTILDNRNGARTEILGGLIYITGTTADPAIPAFRNEDARLFLSYLEESFHPKSTYTQHLVDSQKGQTNVVNADSLPKRTIGRIAPQIVSREE